MEIDVYDKIIDIAAKGIEEVRKSSYTEEALLKAINFLMTIAGVAGGAKAILKGAQTSIGTLDPQEPKTPLFAGGSILCECCGKQAFAFSADPNQWPLALPYPGGNGDKKIYCMGCVADAINEYTKGY